jgi:crotonobetainyl-CoA hydratase
VAEVETQRDGAVLTITLNRPDVLNAFNGAMHKALNAALKEARDDEVRAVVITGAGRGFCVGQDLTEFRDAAGDIGDRLRSTYHPNIVAIRALEKPIIAAVNGAAVAGGFGIMLGCDVAVAADHATFGLPEVKRGLVGVGATSRATLRLPPAVVLELALTGAPMDAMRALHYGLVNRVLPSEEVLPAAVALAEEIAANAPMAVALAKEIVFNAGRLLHVDISEWRERAAPIFASADAREGATAFAEKRPPKFTGT